MGPENATQKAGGVWLWLRPTAVALLASVAVFLGIWLLPNQLPADAGARPQIIVYADRPGLTSALRITMTSNTQIPTVLGPTSAPSIRSPSATATFPSSGTAYSPPPPATRPGYELSIKLSILSPVTKPVMFFIVLQYFPPLMGSGVVPITWQPSGSAGITGPPPPTPPGGAVPGTAVVPDAPSYLALRTLKPERQVPRGTKTAAGAVNLDLVSWHPFGSVSSGSKLKVTFPLFRPKGVGAPGFSSLPIPANEITYRIKDSPSLPEQLYEPEIAPDTTEYFDQGKDLTNFQTLSGDLPTVTQQQAWFWIGVSNVTIIAQDVVAADDEQNHIFWSGILIGVAGGGTIALALELIGVAEKLPRHRKGADKATHDATNNR
jgi:hypothetical protein